MKSQDNEFILVPAFQQFSVPSNLQINTLVVPSSTSQDNQFISVPVPQPYSVPSHLQTNTSIVPSSTSKDNQFVSVPEPQPYSVLSQTSKDNQFISIPAPQPYSAPSQTNISIIPTSKSKDNEFIPAPAPKQYSSPPVSSEIHYAGYTPYNPPGYVQHARPVDPKLQVSYPPVNYAVPGQQIQVTLAEHKTNLQAGFWPGCICPLGLVILFFFFQPPLVAPGGDNRPAIYAKAKQAGLCYGGSSIIGVQGTGFLIVYIIIITAVTKYSYGGYTYTYSYYYTSSFTIYIVIAVIWLLFSAGAFCFGKKRR
ncbi:hypothetical protein HK096_007948 [Nowakowskiella sp. JEL0078]|nr:hypothetical protein HK096_007948 [Nowakowskiella sp. JEL0078]